MVVHFPRYLEEALSKRQQSSALRELRILEGAIDLCSNDYLGVARLLGARIESFSARQIGATGSRLVSGTTAAHEELESYLSAFHDSETALVFGSGYEANLGLLSILGGRHDTIIYDELSHASMRDGISMSAARSYSFRHNDLHDLRAKIKAARGEVFIVVESLYSMDGDLAPLDEICALCEEVGAFLVVDEAHATGIYGPQGAGLVQDTGLQSRVFARVHTFGKALGYKGACVVGPARLREALINFSRPFIYSTAPDLLSLRLMRLAYDTARAADEARQSLRERISDFRELRARVPELSCLPSESAIQAIIIPGNELVVAAERLLSEAGYAVRAIRSPTVPRGSERLRICLHAYNTRRDLEGLFATLGEAVPRRAHGQ